MPSFGRRFLALVLGLQASAFFVQCLLLFHDYSGDHLTAIITQHSHIFVFFPVIATGGLLVAYLPFALLLDYLWHRGQRGRIWILSGVLFALIATLIAHVRGSADPAIWELSSAAYLHDRGEPEACGGVPQVCKRASLRTATGALRELIASRTDPQFYFKIGRKCFRDIGRERTDDDDYERLCLAIGVRVKSGECCVAQRRLRLFFDQQRMTGPSMTGLAQSLVQPFQVLAMSIMLFTGIGMFVWRRDLDQRYPEQRARLRAAAFVCAFAIGIWPLLYHASTTPRHALFGLTADSEYLFGNEMLSILALLAAAAMVFSAVARSPISEGSALRVLTIVLGTVLIVQYRAVLSVIMRLTGGGTVTVFFLPVLLIFWAYAISQVRTRR